MAYRLLVGAAVCLLSVVPVVSQCQRRPSDSNFRESPSLTEYMGLKFWLEDSLSRPVDLTMKKALKLKPWATPMVESIRVA